MTKTILKPDTTDSSFNYAGKLV